MKNAGHTKSVMLNEKPALMIHAVSVVPMLAPMITEIAWARVRRPALTNDTVITVVAVEGASDFYFLRFFIIFATDLNYLFHLY